jgi:hypothetical protein
MPGQNKSVGGRGRDVFVNKWAISTIIREKRDVPIVNRWSGRAIVIAFDELNRERGVPLPPFGHAIQRHRRTPAARMQQVTKNQEPITAGSPDNSGQTLEVVFECLVANWNTMCAKRGRFTEMRVCDQDRPASRPPHGHLRKENQSLARK